MFTNIRYIFLTAIRDKLFAGLLLALILAALIASAMGNTALLEPEQMTLTLAAASLRSILVVGLIVFVCFHLRTAFQSREIDVLLSRPITRSNLVFSYWLGFALLALLLWLPAVGIVAWDAIDFKQGFVMWSLSLLLELWLVVAIALFAGFTLKSAVSSVLASLGFYVLSRMIGFFVATAKSGVLFSDALINEGFRFAIRGVSIVIPRLDFFGKSEWLIYGIPKMDDVWLFILQASIFIPLLIVAAIIDFKRKEF